jgi:rubrerythrin
MASILTSATEADLRSAVSAETLANRRYMAFAAQAEAEGYYRVAALFRAMADRRTRYAREHLETLEHPENCSESRAWN